MSASNLNSNPTADEKPWTVFGTCGEDNHATGGIDEYSFAGVFIAATAADAKSLAREYNGYEFNAWLDIHEVVPGAAKGVPTLIPDSQLHELTNAPDPMD